MEEAVCIMGLIPYDPFRQLSNVRRDFDRLFSNFPFEFNHDNQFGSIRVDVHETENEVIATCDIPGIEKKGSKSNVGVM